MSATSSLARVDDLLRSRNSVHHAVVLLESADGSRRHTATTGRANLDGRFITASISKLFVHAITYALVDRGILELDQPAAQWLGADTLRVVHVISGRDYGDEITLRHLVTHTSGLPNLETAGVNGAPSLEQQVLRRDREVPLSEVLDLHRHVAAKFPPGAGRRAQYSDTNADLLALILERTTDTPYEQLIRDYVLEPLGLGRTGLVHTNTTDTAPVFRRRRPVTFHRYISSQRGSGGIAASASDLMKFLRAFMEGELFSPEHLSNPDWRRTQYGPLQYGPGVMRLQLPRLMSPFLPAPEIIGHSGSTGSFAFYCPPYATYIVGTVNQMSGIPFEYVYRYLNAFAR